MGYGFYDINLYGSSEYVNNKAFGTRNNLISDLYIDFLSGYKPKGTTRISADIGPEDDIKGYSCVLMFTLTRKSTNSARLKNRIKSFWKQYTG